MDPKLQEMIEMSNKVGADDALVQGGGGNTSVKTEDGQLMYVKASGTDLAEMDEDEGYRTVDVSCCLEMLDDEELQSLPMPEREPRVAERLLDCCVDDRPGRPSVETSLHALMGDCVLHTHPSMVMGLMCAQDSRQGTARLFGDMEPPCLYVEYVDPGYPLAAELKDRIETYRGENGCDPRVVFLENHGVFVSAEDADEALRVTNHICDTIESEASRIKYGSVSAPANAEALEQEIDGALRDCYSRVFDGVKTGFSSAESVRQFLKVRNCRQLLDVNPLVPDQVVYCKDMPAWLPVRALEKDPADAVARAFEEIEDGGETPTVMLAEGIGLFSAAPTEKERDYALVTMGAIFDSLRVSTVFGGPRGLSDRAVNYVRNWEAERYRQEQAKDD